MSSIKAIVDQKLILEKMEGKGGWTFARVPKTTANTGKSYGWKNLKGTVDGFKVECSLMPLNKEYWFMPVKAEIRKMVGKQAGDYIQVLLYAEIQELHTPEDFLLCLQDDPQAFEHYRKLPDDEKQKYIDWIFATVDEELQVQRMADAIDRLSRNEKLPKKVLSAGKPA
ncbi:MAG: DUF1905 domain-containing protein [Sphingobacteriales bacterium]|nr:MAG: DUF1905 domain-containing protein [Sphingobacteriales bacterium]